MPLTSPGASLYLVILNRLKTAVPEIRFIDQDLGQLEHYNMRPAVSWPCCLIDIAAFKFSEMQSFNIQLAEGVVILRTGLVQYSNSSSLTPEASLEQALGFYELEQKIFAALHGWNPDGFSKLLRRSASTEQREDDIRVRVMEFALSYTDESAKGLLTKIARPGVTIGD